VKKLIQQSKSRLRVLLILPDGHIHRIRIGPFVRSMREAPLTLTTLAALSPPSLNIDMKCIDGSVSKIPENYPADLVGISVLTGTAPSAYALADRFRYRGITVVLGGVHVTMVPEEAAQHADSIVIGPAEESWPKLLIDFSQGKLKDRYEVERPLNPVLIGVPSPRRDLQCSISYNIPNTVIATRGCRHLCDFCAVPIAWPGYSRRPIADVIRDIQQVRAKLLVINDVSLTDDLEYAKDLFEAMIPLKKHWGGLATVQVVKDQELLELLAKSGCRYLLIGFESLNPLALKEISKNFNQPQEYAKLVETLHDNGITVQGTFIFGFDNDDTSVFDATIQQVNELKIDIPRYSILTPYPGSALYQRLIKEGRILSFNWEDYDTMHVVFRPAQMSPDELYDGFKRAYRETFKIQHIINRTHRLDLTGAINFIGNLTYRRFCHLLYTSPRYANPFSPPNTREYNKCRG
jgi:radical SAM superfamily enzyme YgiQ (UPF0313 family)